MQTLAVFELYRTCAETAIGAFTTPAVVAQGDWVGVRGGDGYGVIGDSSSLPSYASMSVSGASTTTWASSTSDVRGLQTSDTSGRVAAALSSCTSFSIDLDLTGSTVHQVSLYMVDRNNAGRSQIIQVLDLDNDSAVLYSLSMDNFASGRYLYLQRLSGHVQINVTATGSLTAVLSGVFFDT